jgi:hypothetical protein
MRREQAASKTKEGKVAVIMRLVQQFEHSNRDEFIRLEREFAALEHRGILPRGERLMPISSRDPGNTLIWQASFKDLYAAQAALKLFETNPEHTELANQQKHFFKDAWIEFYEVLEC